MKSKTRTWIYISALILLAIVVALQFDNVKALRMRGDENLCMCAMRRPIRPTPEPEQESIKFQQPEQPKRNNDDDDEPSQHRSSAPAPAPVPTACVPQYHAPTLSMGGYTPQYPLVLGQDPDELGVDVTIKAQGGSKKNSCPGDPRGTITTFQLDEITLSPEATARIQGELQKAYPGARVLGSYPLHPAVSVSLGSSATLHFHFDPQDPGAYNVVVTVIQHDGQVVSQTFQVPAHLLEATISW